MLKPLINLSDPQPVRSPTETADLCGFNDATGRTTLNVSERLLKAIHAGSIDLQSRKNLLGC